MSVNLSAESIEAVAQRVVELIRGEQPLHGQLVEAADLARILGRSRDWVYRHADELGAFKLPGERPRLMFDVVETKAQMRKQDARSLEHLPQKAPRGKHPPTNTELLPIRGRVA